MRKLSKLIKDFSPSGLLGWLKKLFFGLDAFQEIKDIKQKIKSISINIEDLNAQIDSNKKEISIIDETIFKNKQTLEENKWRYNFTDRCEIHHKDTVDGTAKRIKSDEDFWHKDYIDLMRKHQPKKFPNAHQATKEKDDRVMYCVECRKAADQFESQCINELYIAYEQMLLKILDQEKVLQKSYIQKHIGIRYESNLANVFKKFHRYKIPPPFSLANNLSRSKSILTDIHLWMRNNNNNFIKSEKIAFKEFFKTVESKPLTDMQQTAVINNELNNLVLAGAGSGKTSVMVAKVGYILKKNLASADEILILAFNKKAQEELSERIEKKIGQEVTVKIFHSLGLGIIAEAKNEKPMLCQWAENSDSTIFTKILNEITKTSKEFYDLVSEYFISFFAPHKTIDDFISLGEYYNYIRNYDIKTFNGEKVRSFEECEIANQLFMWNIKYEYEKPYKINTASRNHRQYIPDFYLTDYDIYIEHFGISRDGQTAPAINSKKYLADMKWKINLHSEHNTTLVQTFSYEKREGTLLTGLRKKLQAYNVNFETIDPEVGLKHFNEQNYTDKLSKLIATFISHFKSRQITIEELKKENLSIRETKFVNLFQFIFNEYKILQSKNECIDFDDMIVEAIKYVDNKQFIANYKYILVDEFQDISIARADLVNALRRHRKDSIITVVGDDWQSINRFAGGDITVIQEFEKIFGDSEAVNLDYTFRFNDVVSKTATNFILKNPKQINKTINTIKKNESHSIYINWYESKESMIEQIQKTIHLIALKDQCAQKKEIKILARNRFVLKLEDFNKVVNPYKDRFNFTQETVHKSKGLEADYVILIGLESSRLGFPSRIENDPILNIVMSQSDNFEDAEERRLMYVALTRTKEKVFLIAHKHQRSCFVDELLNDNKDHIYEINDKSDDFEYCVECKTGLLVKRKDSQDHWFYGCSNYPLCTSTQKIKMCPACNKYELKKDSEKRKAFCKNKECDGFVYLCNECGDYLIKRNGQFGEFLGCESYPECTFTMNIDDRVSPNVHMTSRIHKRQVDIF